MEANYLKAIGTRLKQLRKEAKLTQEDLADAASLNSNYYGRIERGEINVTIETLMSIADALKMNMNEIFLSGEKQIDVKKLRSEINALITKKDGQTLVVIRDLLKIVK